jgi:hypothetical protein
MEIKRIILQSGTEVIAHMSSREGGWRGIYGGSFTEEEKAHLDSIVKDGGADYLVFGDRGYHNVRVCVNM